MIHEIQKQKFHGLISTVNSERAAAEHNYGAGRVISMDEEEESDKSHMNAKADRALSELGMSLRSDEESRYVLEECGLSPDDRNIVAHSSRFNEHFLTIGRNSTNQAAIEIGVQTECERLFGKIDPNCHDLLWQAKQEQRYKSALELATYGFNHKGDKLGEEVSTC